MRKVEFTVLRSAAIAAVATLWIAGCSTDLHQSPDYYRHSLSQLIEPIGGGCFLWFAGRLTPESPANNAPTEAARMQWLTAWLENRKICANGYTILERRQFDYMENNPAGYDLRYKVQCAVGTVPAT